MERIELLNTYNERKTSKKEKIQISKIKSELRRSGDNISKTCLICGKECSGFCQSHTVPKFILDELSSNGHLLSGYSFVGSALNDGTGIRNTLNFYCICNECDNTFFQEYEHEDAFSSKLSNVAINKIAIKSYLRYVWKQHEAYKINEGMLKKPNLTRELVYYYENQSYLSQRNIKEFQKKISYCVKKKYERNFYIIDEIDLPYRTQLAYQGFVGLVWGFDGLINNVFNYDDDYEMQNLGICIFPHKNGTKILLHCKEGANRLRKFYKTYKKLSLNEKLYVINYILMMYEEDWVVDGKFNKNILNKETLLLINQTTILQEYTSQLKSPYESTNVSLDFLERNYRLKTKGEVYNFLEKHI